MKDDLASFADGESAREMIIGLGLSDPERGSQSVSSSYGAH